MTAVTTTSAQDEPTRPLGVGGRLTIHHVADVHALLGAALDAAPSALALDLGEVEEADTAGLQLLLWVAREAREREVRLTVGLSPALDAVLTVAGLDSSALTAEGGR